MTVNILIQEQNEIVASAGSSTRLHLKNHQCCPSRWWRSNGCYHAMMSCTPSIQCWQHCQQRVCFAVVFLSMYTCPLGLHDDTELRVYQLSDRHLKWWKGPLLATWFNLDKLLWPIVMFTIVIMYACSWENGQPYRGLVFFFFYKGICHCKNEPPKISSPRNWNNYTSNRQSNCTSDSKCNLCLLWVQLFPNCTSDSRYINPAQNKRVTRTVSLL